jgi:hypothetical protein
VFCPQCGNEIEGDQAFCKHCGARLTAGSGLSSAGNERSNTPWEDRETIGFFTGLYKTAQQVLFTPTSFFKRMSVTGSLADPLLFALIAGMIGLMFFYFWDIVLRDNMQGLMTPEMKAAAHRGMSDGITSPVGAVLTPFLLIMWLFIVSGLLHLFLMMVHGARAGFTATFRVVSYSVSPFLFMVVPYCGTLIMVFWVMTLLIIGLREAHETSGGKATFAVLFPFLCCCGMAFLALVLFMGALVASFGSIFHMYK